MNYPLLSSLSTQLTDITIQVSEIARSLDEDDNNFVEVQEVERQLQMVGRRLDKIVTKS